jgi:hypothetical protein
MKVPVDVLQQHLFDKSEFEDNSMAKTATAGFVLGQMVKRANIEIGVNPEDVEDKTSVPGALWREVLRRRGINTKDKLFGLIKRDIPKSISADAVDGDMLESLKPWAQFDVRGIPSTTDSKTLPGAAWKEILHQQGIDPKRRLLGLLKPKVPQRVPLKSVDPRLMTILNLAIGHHTDREAKEYDERLAKMTPKQQDKYFNEADNQLEDEGWFDNATSNEGQEFLDTEEKMFGDKPTKASSVFNPHLTMKLATEAKAIVNTPLPEDVLEPQPKKKPVGNKRPRMTSGNVSLKNMGSRWQNLAGDGARATIPPYNTGVKVKPKN